MGNWYLERELGHGRQGVVYFARSFDDGNRRAAVKVLTEDRTRDPAFLAKFPAEMLALHRLDHENIVRLYDSGTHAGLAWYAAELVEGTDLATRLESGPIPWQEVFAIAVQAARALRHAHTRKILHRDLKPAHFLLTATGTLKLSDFGLSRVIPQPPASPTPPLGSSAYLPPETAGGKPFTRRSDFYSLGAVLYTLVTGRPPYAAGSVVELLHKVCYTLPERAGLLVPELPAEFDEVIRGLMDKNPARRPVSAAALLEDLDRLRGKIGRKGETLTVPRDPGTRESEALQDYTDDDAATGNEPGPSRRGRAARFAILLTLFLGVLGGIGYAFLRTGPDAESLYASAQPLLASPNPEDWDRAWDEYLEPLSRKYPDSHAGEVAAARSRILDHREQRRVVAGAVTLETRSEAERCYLRGLRLAQAGDTEAARKTWQALTIAFAGIETEKRWVDLARSGLGELEKQGRRAPSTDRRSLIAALALAKQAATAGKTTDAKAIYAALEELYRNDTDALALIASAMK